tara:strand:+ start:277 stop:450 length:174 start_codon:yes stop_codon:yes gene_type:complete
MSTEEPKLEEVKLESPQKPKKKKTYKQMMKKLLKPRKKKSNKIACIGGGEFEKVVHI